MDRAFLLKITKTIDDYSIYGISVLTEKDYREAMYILNQSLKNDNITLTITSNIKIDIASLADLTIKKIELPIELYQSYKNTVDKFGYNILEEMLSAVHKDPMNYLPDLLGKDRTELSAFEKYIASMFTS